MTVIRDDGSELVIHAMKQRKKYGGEQMKYKIVDEMSEAEAQEIANGLVEAYSEGRAVSLPNPHFREARVSDRFLAPLAARAARQHVSVQSLVDEALEEFLQPA
ncbi:hypothetical protein FYJ63_01190 [Mobiluncus holmesii]|uniref:Uncharacterized protein n=2 Tax=Actinomycetaceae TaxID=2049 RepID=A0A7K0K1G0_9ACTO|nr:hypothetical protein [Mobiluncus porci]